MLRAIGLVLVLIITRKIILSLLIILPLLGIFLIYANHSLSKKYDDALGYLNAFFIPLENNAQVKNSLFLKASLKVLPEIISLFFVLVILFLGIITFFIFLFFLVLLAGYSGFIDLTSGYDPVLFILPDDQEQKVHKLLVELARIKNDLESEMDDYQDAIDKLEEDKANR